MVGSLLYNISCFLAHFLVSIAYGHGWFVIVDLYIRSVDAKIKLFNNGFYKLS